MSEPLHTRPSLRITGLHIERLGAIESLRLPEDGLGWGGAIPPVVIVGGMNGAGKTTLFESLVGILGGCVGQGLKGRHPPLDEKPRIWVDFEFGSDDGTSRVLRWVQGPKEFIDVAATEDCLGFEVVGNRGGVIHRGTMPKGFAGKNPTIPGIVFVPSDGRDLLLPAETYKAPGKLPDANEFIYRWRPPEQWKDSLEALLYSLRWEDLNAQAEGRASPGAFDAYAEEYRQLMGGANRLVWHNATLMVEAGGEHHSLAELSSGEKQILLLLAELRRHWRPGSLVLIDEPELHLHDALQARLYDRLVALQRERGGQVWLATQSGYLFEVAEPNTRLILRRKSAL
jgi:ABC-type transport system involved in cytochrome c biogenesis ATPase subunit